MATLAAAPALRRGRPWPLGAHVEAGGVNFALFSAHATRVELCLLDDDGEQRLDLPACTDQVWHGFLPGAGAGLRYAYRVHGPVGDGHRFDPRRRLLDPYAREIDGVFAYADDTTVPGLHARVVDDDAFDWGDDRPPRTPWADTLLYEVHVKGATRLHPGVPKALRGTYAGLASPAMLEHYRALGVTALKLLPVHAFLDEERLVRSGLSNYWGYNTLAFFALEPRYAAGQAKNSPRDEFRRMVRSLHAAGLEVILDVVFNHTAETDEFGPTLSFRGIDNASYYRLHPDDPQRYENFSGCGNTFKLAHPRALQLTLDALRYWAGEMHVDGFRFDLAAALTRDSAFLAAVAQDPLLSRVKLIAEPWDLGPDGYRLGHFPPGWSEWNDRFRDDVRAFWLTGGAGAGALAQRLAGSSEIFNHAGRAPQAGINFITAHDGFTLRDLVSYAHKHNALNGEGNRDGNDHNHSTNCGAEGDSTDPAVLACRHRLVRALLATLATAQGVPMLQGGDELGRTQAGNNNAYCQDNALTWFAWENAESKAAGTTNAGTAPPATNAASELQAFVAGLFALRRRLPQLRRETWLSGQPDAHGRPDVCWWHPEGRALNEADWQTAPPSLGMLLEPPEPSKSPAPHASDTTTPRLLILYNRAAQPVRYVLPAGPWTRVCATATASPFAEKDCAGAVEADAQAVQIYLQASPPAAPAP